MVLMKFRKCPCGTGTVDLLTLFIAVSETASQSIVSGTHDSKCDYKRYTSACVACWEHYNQNGYVIKHTLPLLLLTCGVWFWRVGCPCFLMDMLVCGDESNHGN